MPKNTIRFDDDRWWARGRALKAFAAAAVLGVAGWQFAKWWQNPIDHEGVKPADNHVVIGDRKVSDPFSVMMKGMGVREGEGATLGTQTLAEALEKTIEQADEPDLSPEQDSKISECREHRQAQEAHVAWQARTDDSYGMFQLLLSLDGSHKKIMGLRDEEYNALLGRQAQKTVDHMVSERTNSALGMMDRYVLNTQIYDFSMKAYLLTPSAEGQLESLVRLRTETFDEAQRLRPDAMKHLVDEWRKIPKPINPDSAEARKFLHTGDAGAHYPYIKDIAGDDIAESLMSDYKMLQQHQWDREKQSLPADYKCADLPVPGGR